VSGSPNTNYYRTALGFLENHLESVARYLDQLNQQAGWFLANPTQVAVMQLEVLIQQAVLSQ
jgi:phage-related protein